MYRKLLKTHLLVRSVVHGPMSVRRQCILIFIITSYFRNIRGVNNN